MAWIRVIDEQDAATELSAAYAEIGLARGTVANILKVHSLHPKVMIAHLRLYKELMFGQSELSRTDRELIATAVSTFNGCHY